MPLIQPTPLKKSQGGLGKLAKIGVGFATGGLGAAALGAAEDTPFTRALSAYNMGSDVFDKGKSLFGGSPSGSFVRSEGRNFSLMGDASPMYRRLTLGVGGR